MDKQKITGLLERVKSKRITVEEAFRCLRHLPYEDIGFAKLDHHRSLRTGFPEVVFCQGKTGAQVVSIFRSLARENRSVLLTRCDEKVSRMVRKISSRAVYNRSARTMALRDPRVKGEGLVSVICAGTADIPVAEEAAVTA